MLTYHHIDQIVANVVTSGTQPLRPEDLAPCDRERLAVIARNEGVSPAEALASARARLLCELGTRGEARRVALLARGERR